MLNNVHVWRVWWPAQVFKLRGVYLKPLCCNSEGVRCRIVLLEFPKSVGKRNGYECMQVISQDAYVRVRVVSRRITPTAHVPHNYRAFTSLNSPLLTCRVNGFKKLSTYPYTSIRSVQLETRPVRIGSYQRSNVGVDGPARRKAFCLAVSKGTGVGLRLWRTYR